MKFLQEIGSTFDPVKRSLEANVAMLAQANQRPQSVVSPFCSCCNSGKEWSLGPQGLSALNSDYRKYLSEYFRTTLLVFGKYARSVDIEYPFSTLKVGVERVTQGGVIPWSINANTIKDTNPIRFKEELCHYESTPICRRSTATVT